jgi:hypothetical protein
MYGSKILYLFDFLGPFSLGGTRWLPAQPFSAIPLYLWFKLVFAWCHRHYIVADGWVCVVSMILAGVPLMSRKLHSSRRESSAAASYPLFWWVFTSRHGYYVLLGGGAIRHSVISLILAYRKSRPCGRHLHIPNPSVLQSWKCVQYAGTCSGSMRLQFGTSSGWKEMTKELQLYKSTFPNRSEPYFAHVSPFVWKRP